MTATSARQDSPAVSPSTGVAPPDGFVRPSEELVRRYDTAGPRYTSYPTVPAWTTQFEAQAYGDRLESAGRQASSEPLSLYFHLPFCRNLCTYCGCNVVITRSQEKADPYVEHLVREMDLALAHLGGRRNVSQLHWGGGTPTFLDERQLERLWSAITERFQVLPDAEVSVELNPAVTRLDQLTLLRKLGFNRVSMGVQDFDPTVQRTINRLQTPEQTEQQRNFARELGFSGVNFDLIYGLPHQNTATWDATLDRVLQMRPDRFAIYPFAFLPESLPHQKKLPQEAMPSGSIKLDLLLRAYGRLVEAGYRAIGMDHFALPEDELAQAQSRRQLWRNFQGYTVKTASDVVSFGASAISDAGGAYAQNTRELPAYYARIDQGQLATERGMVMTDDDKRRRAVINNLMCNFWVDLGTDGTSYFAKELERLSPFEQDGLLERKGSELSVLPAGRFFVRNMAMVFDAYLTATQSHTKFSRTV